MTFKVEVNCFLLGFSLVDLFSQIKLLKRVEEDEHSKFCFTNHYFCFLLVKIEFLSFYVFFSFHFQRYQWKSKAVLLDWRQKLLILFVWMPCWISHCTVIQSRDNVYSLRLFVGFRNSKKLRPYNHQCTVQHYPTSHNKQQTIASLQKHCSK